MIRSALLLAAACASLLVPASARAALVTDRGIVQSISATELQLRELDGSLVAIRLGPATQYLVNGKASVATDVQAGFVATVVRKGSRPALLVRAVGKPQKQTDRGVVVSVALFGTTAAIRLREANGTMVTIAADGATFVELDGIPSSLTALRPGLVAVAVHRGSASALELRLRTRRY